MIAPWKLRSLPAKTRLRKIARILQAAELDLERCAPVDAPYLGSCAALIEEDLALKAAVRRSARRLAVLAAAGPVLRPEAQPAGRQAAAELRRAMNRLRHEVLAALGEAPAEWDFLDPDGPGLDASSRTVYPLEVYLEEVRSPFNVGSIFRSADAFGVRRIRLSPGTASPLHARARKTARGAVSVIPWRYDPLSLLEGRTGLVALELGGTPLERFEFPRAGVLLVGSEELGLSAEALALAGGGRVSIPMAGAKRSLNVAAAFAVAVHAWAARLSPFQGL